MFRSLIYSSRLEILTSKSLSSFLYLLFGVAVSVWWLSACYQFIESYLTINEFDVSASSFIFTTLIFFLPLVITGAFMLATLLQRLRLKLWFKRIVNYPLYESLLRPVEAGFIVDYEFSREEVNATLLDLYYRSIINLTKTEKTLVVQLISWPGSLSLYERTFLTVLLDGKSEVHLISLEDARLTQAGQAAHEALADSLKQDGKLPDIQKPSQVQEKLVKFITRFGTRVGLIVFFLFIFEYDKVSTVLYPRYPVHISEMLILIFVNVVWVSIIISGFWPRFSDSSKSKPTAAWLEAEGFRQYLQTVFKDRMSAHSIHAQDPKTIQNVLPFMVAYNLVHLSDTMLGTLLAAHQKNNTTNPSL